MNNIDLQSVTTFLYKEAGFLDRPDLEAWLDLYTIDATYWMPAAEDQADPLNHISHIYDDRVLMEIRKRNFVHPRAPSKDSAVRCSHIIGNVHALGETEQGDVKIGSNFQVVMYYREEQRLFAGTYEHHLVPTGNARDGSCKENFLIRHKRVNLINAEAAHKSIIIYL